MNFNGRWVPIEVMQTIFGLWVVIALLVLGVTYWIYRTRPMKHGHEKLPERRRKKSKRRKRQVH